MSVRIKEPLLSMESSVMSEVTIRLTDKQRRVICDSSKRYRATTEEMVKAMALVGVDMVVNKGTSDEFVLDAFQEFVDANGVPGNSDPT